MESVVDRRSRRRSGGRGCSSVLLAGGVPQQSVDRWPTASSIRGRRWRCPRRAGGCRPGRPRASGGRRRRSAAVPVSPSSRSAGDGAGGVGERPGEVRRWRPGRRSRPATPRRACRVRRRRRRCRGHRPATATPPRSPPTRRSGRGRLRCRAAHRGRRGAAPPTDGARPLSIDVPVCWASGRPVAVASANPTRSRPRSSGQPWTRRARSVAQSGHPVAGAEQAAGDRGDGVGVVADRDRGLQRGLDVVGALDVPGGVDRRPGRLQGGHRVAVAGERRRRLGFGLVDEPEPLGAALPRAAAAVRRGRRGVPRSPRPGRPRTTARTSPRTAWSAWVSAATRAAASAVARGSSRATSPTTPVRIRAPLPARPDAAAASDASVIRRATGPVPRRAAPSTVEVWAPMSLAPWACQSRNPAATASNAVVGAQVGAGRGHLGDADRHLGVVGPLPRRVRAQPAAHHPGLTRGDPRPELVRDAQRVPDRLPEQDAARPVLLLAGEPHAHHHLTFNMSLSHVKSYDASDNMSTSRVKWGHGLPVTLPGVRRHRRHRRPHPARADGCACC